MTFCEIVHHTRKSFSLEQLGGVVSYLSCCVADRSLPFTTQSTCVRLSLNLVECLYQVRAAQWQEQPTQQGKPHSRHVLHAICMLVTPCHDLWACAVSKLLNCKSSPAHNQVVECKVQL